MLFAVEGGGFFSSSASGYSKALTLLLLGQKHEDEHMRATPWNHYQLVDRDSDSDLQLASLKNWFPCRCTSFVCFGRASPELGSASPPEVGPARKKDVLPDPLAAQKVKDCTSKSEDFNTLRKLSRKSSLKKSSSGTLAHSENANLYDASKEHDGVFHRHTERRKVQWTDVCGSELAQIREFEPSEMGGSDDEFNNRNDKRCSCVIM